VATSTGLAANPDEYRTRLRDQSDEQIDVWTAELMRDMSIRRGVLKVLEDFRRAAGLSDDEVLRVYAAGGGPPATVGRTADGHLMIPAIALHALVAGLRRETKDAKNGLIEYLVANFQELVYI
jgi:hypothetical protein